MKHFTKLALLLIAVMSSLNISAVKLSKTYSFTITGDAKWVSWGEVTSVSGITGTNQFKLIADGSETYDNRFAAGRNAASWDDSSNKEIICYLRTAGLTYRYYDGRYFAILNLKNGDKVKIKAYNNGDFKVAGTSIIEGKSTDDTLDDNTEYSINNDGNLILQPTGETKTIQYVTIISTYTPDVTYGEFSFLYGESGGSDAAWGDAVVNNEDKTLKMLGWSSETFGNRFAASTDFKFRQTGDYKGLWASASDKYLTILNLKEGDKVTFTLNSSSNNIKFVGGDAVVSGQEYVVASDGDMDLVTTGAVYIEKIKIEPASEKITIGAKTESYDFASIASETTFTTAGASTTIVLGIEGNDFNNRFSLGTDSRNIAFKGTGYGLQLIFQNRGLFINDLKAGDQVKITYTNEGSQVFKFVNGGNVGEDATATVSSNSWYTVKADGQLQMINTTNGSSDKTNITAVEIKTYNSATTATTLVSSKALDFTGTDIAAYIATSATTSAVTLKQVYKVDANTPLFIQVAAGGYYEIPVLSETAEDVADNMFNAGDGSKKTASSGHTYYVYGTPASGTAGFYKVGANGITVPTGKAYLDVMTGGSAAPNFLGISFDGAGSETTVVDGLKREQPTGEAVYYNLNGQRIAQPTKGLYIVNGKKVIIK